VADHVCTTVGQLNTAFANAVAGDNILPRGVEGGGSGYYQTTNDTTGVSEVRINAGFHFANSGSSGNPITLKPYPGDTPPTLSNRPSGSPSYFRFPTITVGANSYITIDGIKVDGAIYVFSDQNGGSWSITGTTMTGGGTRNIVKNCEIWEGWETTANGGDGNWAGIFGCGQTFLLLQSNLIHDINGTANCNNMSSMTGIKLFSCIDTITEYNTVYKVIGYSQAACLDDKQDSIRNTHRFNWFEDVSTGPRIQNQKSGAGASAATGTKFYQNLIFLGNYNGRGFTHEAGPITDYEFYNNSIVAMLGSVLPGSDDGVAYAGNDDYPATAGYGGAKFYNNIFYGPTSSKNLAAYAQMFASGGLCDYNHYSDTTLDFRYYLTTYADLAAWQAVFDANATSGNPLFTNASGQILTLEAGSPCINTGKVGGVSGGANITKGCYITGSEQIGHVAPPADPTNPLPPFITIMRRL